jgi:hypothetical protein
MAMNTLLITEITQVYLQRIQPGAFDCGKIAFFE